MMVSADILPYQNGSDELVSILMGPLGLNWAIFFSSAGHSYASCCAAESHRTDTYTQTEENLCRNRQKIDSVFTWGWESFRPEAARLCVCVSVYFISVWELIANVVPWGNLLIHTVWMRSEEVWIPCAFWSFNRAWRAGKVQPITSSSLLTYAHPQPS